MGRKVVGNDMAYIEGDPYYEQGQSVQIQRPPAEEVRPTLARPPQPMAPPITSVTRTQTPVVQPTIQPGTRPMVFTPAPGARPPPGIVTTRPPITPTVVRPPVQPSVTPPTVVTPPPPPPPPPVTPPPEIPPTITPAPPTTPDVQLPVAPGTSTDDLFNQLVAPDDTTPDTTQPVEEQAPPITYTPPPTDATNPFDTFLKWLESVTHLKFRQSASGFRAPRPRGVLPKRAKALRPERDDDSLPPLEEYEYEDLSDDYVEPELYVDDSLSDYQEAVRQETDSGEPEDDYSLYGIVSNEQRPEPRYERMKMIRREGE